MKFRVLEKVLTVYKGRTKLSQRLQTYMIYKNPSVQDLNSKDESKDNRGIIDHLGNLFVEAMWLGKEGNKEEYSYLLHGDLLKILHENGECLKLHDMDLTGIHDPSAVKNGLFVVRDPGNSKRFHIADYAEDVLSDIKSKKMINRHFEKCKKKNPFLLFKQSYVPSRPRKLSPEEKKLLNIMKYGLL